MEWLNQIDTQLLLFLNGNKNTFWDMTILLLTRKESWISMYLIVLFFLLKQYKRSALFLIPMLILTIILNDQISGFIKDTIERFRPYRDPNISHLINIVRKPSGTYGFVSAHAANAFGFMTFTSMVFRNRIYTIFFLFWAILVGYTRIYLGVHFPGDVIAGGIMGTLIGWGMYRLTTWLENHFMANAKKTFSEKLPSRDTIIIILVTVVTILTIVSSVTKLVKYNFL